MSHEPVHLLKETEWEACLTVESAVLEPRRKHRADDLRGTIFMRGKRPGRSARVAEPGTATEPVRSGALGVEPRDRKGLDQVSCWSSGPRGFKSHPGRLHNDSTARCSSMAM